MTAVDVPQSAGLAGPTPPGWISRLASHRTIRLILPVVIVAITFVVLHKLAAHVGWAEVKADIAASSWLSLGLAVCATAFSFLGLSFYDVLGLRSSAKGQVPWPVAAYTGATGAAISNLLGFSYLTGTAVRYHIYSSLGLDMARIAGVIATAWTGFWFGLILIFGVFLVIHPVGLTVLLPIPKGVETVTGLAILAATGVLFGWLGRGGRDFHLAGFAFNLPSLRIAGFLLLAALVDLVGASATLYILMPGDLTQNAALFFMVYVAAIALGIVSHAPGGLGVFEATMIAGLGATGRSDVLAALLLYRLVYTVLPFAIAVSGLAIAWAYMQRHVLGRTSGLAYRVMRPIVPTAAAGVAFVSGSILLISGSLPGDGSRLHVLGDMLPVSFIEASHLAGSVAGLLLVVISRGLYRKLYRAWMIAVVLMGAGLIASVAKGLDWEEAFGILTSLAILVTFRSAFYRVEGSSVFHLSVGWIVSLFALLAAVFWIGLFAYSHIAYRDALWWQFALTGDASRFLRASLVVALVMIGIALNSVLNQRSQSKGPTPIPDAVRRLAQASPDAHVQIALLGDKEFLVAEDDSAYLSYGDTGGSLISNGDPVGDEAAGRALIWQLREKADRLGKRCAFYAVSPRYLPTYLDLGLSILKIGEVARVDLAGFTFEGSGRKDFRQARARLVRDGYEFAIIPRAELSAHMPALRAVSDAWMAMKQGEEKSFAMGSFDEVYLSNFDHAVLRDVTTGQIIAFANLYQGAEHFELSLDLMRHDPAGPKMAMDALFGDLMMWAAAQGFRWFSLGPAPFAGIDSHQLASLWNRIGGFVYAHGEQFYHFEGLRTFKQKFGPEWTPNYLASPGGLAAPRILYEVNVLISGGIKGLLR